MNKIKKLLTLILSIICIIGLIYSTKKIIEWIDNKKENNDIKEETKKYIKIEKENEEEKYIVDFKTLKEQNNDTVAYLKVNNTDVEYVVVKGTDNEYYLNHNFNKEYNVAGWIFADYKNNLDGTDKNIIIYGHNMKDGSMFAPLKEILKEQKKETITLITQEKTITYEIFSSYTINPEEYYITTNFEDDEAYMNFLNTIKQRSIYDYDVNINEFDKIITLSTCTETGKNRIVVHAKQILEEKNK